MLEEAQGKTIAQVAAELGMSKRQVWRYVQSGKIEATRVQGKYGEEWRIHLIPQELLIRRARPKPSPMTPKEAMDMLQALTKENQQLAYQLGQSNERIRQLEAQVLLLTAPKPSLFRRLFLRKRRGPD